MKSSEEEILHQIALLEIDNVGPTVARKLITHYGSATQIFKSSKKELLALGVTGASLANGIGDASNLNFAEAQLKFCENQGAEIISYYDSNFPFRLKNCVDAPLILYQKGRSDLNHNRMVAIVGTRQCTGYGKSFTAELIKLISEFDGIAVSGLAYGIDAEVHKSSVRNDLNNIGVLAHGLDRLYPSDHKGLAQEMLNNGSLLTEYPIHTNPDRENFPKRNRIVAGLVDAVVVVESAIKGGSMITAKLGNDYNRDVFALPGRVGDENSEGCNHLIKTSQAHLMNSPQDLAYLLGWGKSESKSVSQHKLPLDLDEKELLVVQTLNDKAKSIDEIAVTLEMSVSELSSQLLMLELKGVLKQLPGKKYSVV